jgi:small subunit ribosomal protein S18
MNRPSNKPRVIYKNCFYCEAKKDPFYRDTDMLSKFMSERGKIMARSRTGICSKHQRKLTKAIKQARHVALLPFIVRA